MNSEPDIAIIGLACRFPGARNPKAFWDNLVQGVESITRFSDEELLREGVPANVLARPDYVKASPILEEAGLFDAAFFGLSPSEAAAMDPQHRCLLELAFWALEDAGCDPERYSGRMGVFAGSALNTYFTNSGQHEGFAENYIPTLIVNDKDFLCTRISYLLGLQGPSLTVQSACSTSLVAVHLARQSLLLEETDVALAGAVSIRVPHRAGYFYNSGGVVSPDGHVRAFDAGANGTVFGSGAGVVVLKRLRDAVADGDQVYGVIKGSAVNNDGSARAGYTAPSVDGQAAVVAEALANAGVDANSLSYWEAHGTGTALGDVIELRALAKAFQTFTERKGFCAIGSVKTNVGHLDAAAGMAGLIKTVLALQHGFLPASLNYAKANPEIDFESTPFVVNSKRARWPSLGEPKRAGVMATGMGGTNACLILEEAPVVAPRVRASGPFLMTLSAKTPAALAKTSTNLADFLDASRRGLPVQEVTSSPRNETRNGHAAAREDADSALLANLAFTLQTGRKRFPCRRFLICRNAEQAVATLKTPDPRTTCSDKDQASPHRPIVFLLPGVGDHYIGMGQGLYDQFEVFRNELDKCAQILRPLLDFDIREKLYPRNGIQNAPVGSPAFDFKRMLGRAVPAGTDLSDWEQAIVSHPAIFSVEYALARLWMSWGVRPTHLIGQSLGEYVAACLAGVMSLAGALRLVVVRAKLVSKLPLASMVAVLRSESELRPLLGEELSISLINGPQLCVVAGPKEAIASFQIQLKKLDYVFRPVRNSHAFHSRMLQPIAAAFFTELEQARFQAAQLPYLSNVSGTWITTEQALNPHYWVDHACQTARFNDGLEQFWQLPGAMALEVGPGRTLGVLASQHPGKPGAAGANIFSSLRHGYETRSDMEHILQTIGNLWVRGMDFRWEQLDPRGNRQKISLPSYPYEGKHFWLQAPVNQKRVENHFRGLSTQADVGDWFYVPAWQQSGLLGARENESGVAARWLILGEKLPLAEQFLSTLRFRGETATLARFAKGYRRRGDNLFDVSPNSLPDFSRLLNDLAIDPAKPLNIVFLGSLSPGSRREDYRATPRSQEFGFYSLLTLAKAIADLGLQGPIRIAVLTCQIHEVTGTESLNPAMATVLGPCGVIPKELLNVCCFAVDLPDTPSTQPDLEATVEHLFSEFRAASPGSVIAHRGRYRWERIFRKQNLAAVTSKAGAHGHSKGGLKLKGVYLVTGGTGGLGLAVARHLAETCQARLILTKRTPFLDRSKWNQALADSAVSEDDRHIITALREIEALGSEVEVVACNVADQEGMRRIIDQTLEKHGAIHGAIHAAGIVRAGLIQAKSNQEIAAVLEPKVFGTQVLYEAVKDLGLDFLVLFSSVTSILTPFAEADYSGGNAFLDAFAYHANRQGKLRTMAINWPGWKETGQLTHLKSRIGLEDWKAEAMSKAILTRDGIEAFARALPSGLVQVIVSPSEFNELLRETLPVPSRVADTRERDFKPIAGLNARSSPRSGASDLTPASLEQQLRLIWADLLGYDDVGSDDDFFELGGHSLLAIRLLAQVEELTGQRLLLSSVFEARTIRALVDLLKRPSSKKYPGQPMRRSCLVPIRTDGAGLPLFCIHAIGGNVLNFEELARCLAPQYPVYGIQSRGLIGFPCDSTVEAMAAHYIAEMRERQSEGPYLVCGHSFGGLIAYEIGVQLTAAGESVGMVALLDTEAQVRSEQSPWLSFRTELPQLWDRFQGHTRRILMGPDRIEYLRVGAQSLREKAEMFAVRAKLQVAPAGGQELLSNLRNVKQANYVAAGNYRPKPFPGSVTLFRSLTRSLGDHPDFDLGWGDLALNGVHVEETPGDHSSMMKEPHVQVLSAKMRQCMEKAALTPSLSSSSF